MHLPIAVSSGVRVDATSSDRVGGVLAKAERARLFLRELAAAAAKQPPRSKSEALALINAVMSQVEDRHSGIPWRPGAPLDRDCGRMLPLADDLRLGVVFQWGDMPLALRLVIPNADYYGTKGNEVFIAANGAFEIWTLQRTEAATGIITPPTCLLRWPGADGQTITRPLAQNTPTEK